MQKCTLNALPLQVLLLSCAKHKVTPLSDTHYKNYKELSWSFMSKSSANKCI